jgi:hypothetical protein
MATVQAPHSLRVHPKRTPVRREHRCRGWERAWKATGCSNHLWQRSHGKRSSIRAFQRFPLFLVSVEAKVRRRDLGARDPAGTGGRPSRSGLVCSDFEMAYSQDVVLRQPFAAPSSGSYEATASARKNGGTAPTCCHRARDSFKNFSDANPPCLVASL